jgi:hypothetical protein
MFQKERLSFEQSRLRRSIAAATPRAKCWMSLLMTSSFKCTVMGLTNLSLKKGLSVAPLERQADSNE